MTQAWLTKEEKALPLERTPLQAGQVSLIRTHDLAFEEAQIEFWSQSMKFHILSSQQ